MRRIGMVLLAILLLFMIFAAPVAQKVDAVVVSTVVVGAVIAAMAAAGIGLTVSGMTSAQLSDWVSGKLNDWATAIGGTVQDHIDNNLITVTGRGILSIGTSAANSIANFLGWLKNDENLSDNDTVSVITEKAKSIAVLNFIPTVSDLESVGTAIKSNVRLAVYDPTLGTAAACCYVSTPFTYVCVASLSQITSYWELNASNPVSSKTATYNSDLGIYVANGPNDAFGNNLNMPYYSNRTACLNALEAYLKGDTGSLDIETGVITIPTIDTTNQDKWFLDVGAEPGTTVETVTDGVIAETIDGSLTVSGEVAEEEPEFVVNEPIGVSGLTEIFPFCIPFDVYALLSCLSAEPQTPVFTVRFVIPGVINQEFTIDLTPFSTIAQIVRTMELIAFAIGLALVTRERFLRS